MNSFKDFLYYLPTNPPMALAIEVQLEKFEYLIGDRKITSYKLVSVKHEEIELLEPYEDNEFNAISVNFEEFINRLHKELCVPKNMLRLSMNVKDVEVKSVSIPWTLKLSRQKKDLPSKVIPTDLF